MNTTAVLILLALITLIIIAVPVFLIIVTINKKKESKNTEIYNQYNDFHLGEMTRYDVPKNNYIKGPKINKKYYGRTKMRENNYNEKQTKGNKLSKERH
jgi:hypothetical protein